VNLSAGLDRYGKISPTPGFEQRTVQPIASGHVDYGMLVLKPWYLSAEVHSVTARRTVITKGALLIGTCLP
jgi:hypothetical protein